MSVGRGRWYLNANFVMTRKHTVPYLVDLIPAETPMPDHWDPARHHDIGRGTRMVTMTSTAPRRHQQRRAAKAPTGRSKPSPATPTGSAIRSTSDYAPAAPPPDKPADTSTPANLREPLSSSRVDQVDHVPRECAGRRVPQKGGELVEADVAAGCCGSGGHSECSFAVDLSGMSRRVPGSGRAGGRGRHGADQRRQGKPAPGVRSQGPSAAKDRNKSSAGLPRRASAHAQALGPARDGNQLRRAIAHAVIEALRCLSEQIRKGPT